MMRRLQRWAPVLALFVAVVALRALCVAAWGASVPYWDQWDAEGANLLQPWVEGTWTPAQLLSAHNEHRVAFSRLLVLALFEANGGQWDNLVGAFANTLLYGAIAASVFALLRGGIASRALRLLFAVGMLVLSALPFDWENLFVGFQSQFHFLALSALATVALAARLPDRPRSPVLLWTVALCGLFTMASGLLAAVAAGGVLALRGRQRQWRAAAVAVAIAGLAAIAVAGLLAVPHIDGHQVLQAQGAGEWLHALGRVLGWPWGGWLPALALWFPSAWLAQHVLRRGDGDRHTLFALGLAAWVLLQAAAMAWSRGHELQAAPSRYTGILALGLAVNGWIGLRALAATARPLRWAGVLPTLAMLLGVLVAAIGLYRNLPADLGQARERLRIAQIQAGHVRAFVITRDPAELQVPFHHIPYPEAKRLQLLLRSPTLRAMLPWSVRAPATADRVVADGTTRLVVRGRRAGNGWLWPALADGHDVSVVSRQPARTFVHGDGWLAAGDPVAIGPLSAAAARLQFAVQSRFARRPAIGRGLAEVRVDPRLADGRPSPLPLVDGARASGRLRAPATGQLWRLALPVGTYGAAVGGELRLRVCAAACRNGVVALAGTVDNAEVVFALDAPLPVVAGERLRWSLHAADTGNPVALWLQPQPPGFALVRGSDGEVRQDVAPGFVFGFLR